MRSMSKVIYRVEHNDHIVTWAEFRFQLPVRWRRKFIVWPNENWFLETENIRMAICFCDNCKGSVVVSIRDRDIKNFRKIVPLVAMYSGETVSELKRLMKDERRNRGTDAE